MARGRICFSVRVDDPYIFGSPFGAEAEGVVEGPGSGMFYNHGLVHGPFLLERWWMCSHVLRSGHGGSAREVRV